MRFLPSLCAWAAALTIVVSIADGVEGQTGLYNFPSNMKTGVYTQVLNGANTWPIGQTQTIRQTFSCCDQLVFQITPGSTWTSLSVQNLYSCQCCWCCCSCKCAGACAGCVDGAHNPITPGIVAPFVAHLMDTSGTAVFDVPTRQNTPSNMVLRATTMTIPQFVATSWLTSSMLLNVTFVPRAVNQLLVTSAQSGSNFYCGTPESSSTPPYNWMYRDYAPLMNPVGAQRSLGIYFQAATQKTWYSYCLVNFWFTRRAPVPPFYILYNSNIQLTYNPERAVTAQWTSTSVTNGDIFAWSYHNPFDGNAGYGECSSCTAGNDPTWSIEFFEDVRLNSVAYSLNIAQMLFQLKSAPGYAITVVPNSTVVGFKLRFVWWNITNQFATAAQRAELNQTFGVEILQPFPIADLWVQATDNTGTRLFTEVDRHVPYIQAAGAGNLGYQFAVNNLYGSTTATITVAYNRRVSISTFTETTKGTLLLRHVSDQGGNMANLISPIPRTILPLGGVMGVVSAVAGTTGTTVATVMMRSALTSQIVDQWYADTLKMKFESTNASRGIDWWTLWVNATDLWFKRQVVATIMVSTWSRSSIDRSTNWWVMTDAFYPEQPTMLPHFWDAQLRQRLLGFTEMVNFVNTDLNNWAYEYNLISYLWPVFGQEVSLLRYQSVRGYLIRTGHVVGPNMSFIPVVNAMRHTSTGSPNVQIIHNWPAFRYDLVLLSNVSTNDELFPDFGAANYAKQQYLLYFGACPSAARDAATIPNFNGYLFNNDQSRANVVNAYAATFQETYQQSLSRLLTVMQVKLGSLPITVDGSGATPDVVNMATTILGAERSVLTAQITAGAAEYAGL